MNPDFDVNTTSSHEVKELEDKSKNSGVCISQGTHYYSEIECISAHDATNFKSENTSTTPDYYSSMKPELTSYDANNYSEVDNSFMENSYDVTKSISSAS